MVSHRQNPSSQVAGSVFGRLLLFILLVPLIELVLLSQLLQRTGLVTTIVFVLLTGFIGVTLTRRQGMKAWRAVHEQMANGQSPSREILNAVMILLAGAFLITPGLLTDCVGFSLLIPQVRIRLGRWLTRWFMQRTASTFQMQGWTGTSFDASVPETDSETQPASVRVLDPDRDAGDSPASEEGRRVAGH